MASMSDDTLEVLAPTGPDSPIDEAQVLGSAVWLWMHSAAHRDAPLHSLSTLLLPAAISTGIGSETQKPLAIVVIGGLITSTILTLLMLPVIYYGIYNLIHLRKNRKLLTKLGALEKE